MHKLLWTLALSLSAVYSSSCAAMAGDVARILSDADMAEYVFVGKESTMPIAPDKYYLSIEPSLLRNRKYFVPTTTIQALREMRRALPSWFLNALGRSHGNAECSVVVTEGDGMDSDFFTIAQDWFWIHWNLQDATSRLRKELAGHNLTDRFIIEQAFRAGLCRLVKSDPEQRALEIMMKYGKP